MSEPGEIGVITMSWDAYRTCELGFGGYNVVSDPGAVRPAVFVRRQGAEK